MKATFNLEQALAGLIKTHEHGYSRFGVSDPEHAKDAIPEQAMRPVEWDTITFSARGTLEKTGQAISVAISIAPKPAEAPKP